MHGGGMSKNIHTDPGSGFQCARNIQTITAHGGDYLEENHD